MQVEPTTGSRGRAVTWHPEFRRALDRIQDELYAARRVVQSAVATPSTNRPGYWESAMPHAADHTRNAIRYANALMSDWDDLPEPALDTLRGVIVDAELAWGHTQTHGSHGDRRMQSVVDELLRHIVRMTGRLDSLANGELHGTVHREAS